MNGPCAGCDPPLTQGGRARAYLGRLGKLSHPDAERDPVGALGQVAIDLQQALNLVPERRCLGSCGALEARRQAFASARCAVLQEFRLACKLGTIDDWETSRLLNTLQVAVEGALARAAAAPPGPPEPPPPPRGRMVA